MTDPYREHPNEEALERFLLKHSSEEELEVVETHIFACEMCVEQLEALEIQIAATKLALTSLEAKRLRKEAAKLTRTWRSWFTIPHISYATAFAGLVLGAIIFSIPRDVNITAYRGSESVIVSQWRPLHLHLIATGLPAGPTSIEIVDVNGSTIWRGGSVITHDALDTTIPRLKNSGQYFLRLYSAARNDSEPELLREFAIQAKSVF